MAVSVFIFLFIIFMVNIQKARIDAHVSSLDLEQDLHDILQNHATDDEVESIKNRVNGIV